MNGSSQFVKCAVSYPDAAIALGEFRELVQQKCLKVFEKHIASLASAFGYERELQEAVGYSDPDRPNAKKRTAFEIGAKAVHSDGTQFYSSVYWYKDSVDTAECSVGLMVTVLFKNSELQTAITEEIQVAESDPRFKRQKWIANDSWPEIYWELTKGQIAEFDTHLDELFKWSISAIRSRPKIKKLVRAAFK